MSDDDHDDSSKTEDPTPKKLEEARKKGQVPMSREINNFVMLLAGALVLLAMGPAMMSDLAVLMRTYIEHAHDMPEVPGGFQFVVIEALREVLKIIMLPLLFLIAAAFVGPFIQVGPLFAPEVIKMDVSKISPMKGFSRLFSLKSIMEFVKGLLKIAIVSAVGFLILKPFFGTIDHLVGLPVPLMMDETMSLITRMLIGLLFVVFIIAVLDLVYQRYEHMKKMRMTKQELKDEYRQSEGDPHVKAKLRQLRQEKARARMMQAVPDATVIITNPTHYSVALRYEPDKGDGAPVCVAKGVDALALRIREVAREHKVPIVENVPLARALYAAVEVDGVIPREHFEAAAKVIGFVMQQRKRR